MAFDKLRLSGCYAAASLKLDRADRMVFPQLPNPTPLSLSVSKATLCVGLLALASCSEPAPAPVGDAIECALDGAVEFTKACTMQQDGQQLIVHRPDGGFRRLEKSDGGVRPLDGADEGSSGTVRTDGATELTLDADRYRIPMSAIVP